MMSTGFEKLLSYLQQRNINLSEYQNYLQDLDGPYPLLTQSLTQRNIPLQELYRFLLKNTSSSGPPENRIVPKNLNLKQIGGYTLLDLLGEGGMGVVYKAYHPGLNQISAIKLIKAELHASDKIMKRFLREMQLMAKLDHPGIVKILNSGEEDGHFYFVMEYVQGTSLEKKQTELSLREKIEIMMKVLKALEAAHQKKIIHRDLKLQNILLSETGEPKIADFGLAKDISKEKDSLKLTQSGILIGTSFYMAPEQLRGENNTLDARTDIYAIGVCLYKLLSGQFPHHATRLQELAYHVENEAPRPLSKNKPPIHRDLEAVTLKALEKEPEQRYQNAAEFAQDLQNFLRGLPVDATLPSGLERWKRWKKKNPQWFRGIVLGALLLPTFFLGMTGLKQQEITQQIYKKYLNANSLYQEARDHPKSFRTPQSLFDALHLINQIPHEKQDSEIERLKWEIGKSLLKMAYENRSYYWANYLVQELQLLTSIPFDTKKQLHAELVDESQKELKQQKQRLKQWKDKLQRGIFTPLEEQDAIDDILKMSNQEIVQQILNEIIVGTEYTLHRENTAPVEPIRYYKIFLKVAKYWKKPELRTALKEGLHKLFNKMDPLEEGKIQFEELEYLILLYQAIFPYSTSEDIPFLRKVRLDMGVDSLFWKRTRPDYERWLHQKKIVDEAIASIRDLFSQAVFYLDTENYEKAIECFTQFIAENPQTSEAYNSRGFARAKQKDFTGAITDYTEAIRLNSQDELPYLNRGNAKIALNDIPGALTDYTESIRINPKFSDAHHNLGLLKYNVRDFEGAIRHYTEAIRHNPQSIEAYTNRGQAKTKLNDFTGAIADYTEAIRLNPQHSETYNNRGNAKTALRDFVGAIVDFNETIRLNPQYPLAYYNRGIAKTDLQDFTGAVLDFNEAIQMNPEYTDAYFNRAYAKTDLQDFTGALADYAEVIRQSPENSDAYGNRGLIKRAMNDFEGALRDFDHAIQIQPQSTSVYINRGNLKNSLKDFDGAIRDFNDAIKLNPQAFEAYFSRGLAFYHQQKRNESKSDFIEFLRLTQQKQDSQILHAYNQVFSLFPELKAK